MSAPRVLIVGCGYVGSALGVRLAAAGHLVWGLRRDRSSLPTAIQPVEADLLVPNTLRNLPLVDHVVYLASPDEETRKAHRAVRVAGLRYLLGALHHQRQKIRRFFLASDVAVYGRRGGDWVDEDSEPRPEGFRGELAREGEALLAEAGQARTVVRFGFIYGPGRLGPLAEVIDGRARVSDPRAHLNTVHRDDCAGVLAHLIALDRSAADLYLGVDREPTPRVAVLQWLAAQLDRPMPTLTPVDPSGSEDTDARCMSDRLVEAGYRFRYPTFREGFGPLLSRWAVR